MTKKIRTEILTALEERYRGMGTALHYSSAFELLTAVILSSQCTDERVNKVTAKLFPRFNAPEKMLALTQEELEAKIRECGFFRSKAKNLLGMCRGLLERFDGEVPRTVEELKSLPGVGQKTADVIVSVAFGVPAIAVDTHVFRTSHRLGLSSARDPEHTELDLQKIIPREKWAEAHHWFIWHGRLTCRARRPLCTECVCLGLCPFKEKNLPQVQPE